MSKVILPVLFLLLVAEWVVAVIIVLNTPGGLGNFTFNVGPEKRSAPEVQNFEVGANATGVIIADIGNSRIDVKGDTAATQVSVKATKVTRSLDDSAFDKINYTVVKNGNNIEIKVNTQNFSVGVNFGGDRVEFEVTAPASMVNQLRTNNGSITVTGFNTPEGSPRLETDNGTITATNLAARRLDMKSDNGRIRLDNVTATLNAETDNGRIEAIGSTLSLERVKSNNGAIDLSGKLQQTGNGSIESNNGSVRLSLEQASSARYQINTDNGRIDFRVPGVQTQSSRNSLTSLNQGPTITIRTDNGSVTVE